MALYERDSQVEIQSGGADASQLRFAGLSEHGVHSQREVEALVARGMMGKTVGSRARGGACAVAVAAGAWG